MSSTFFKKSRPNIFSLAVCLSISSMTCMYSSNAMAVTGPSSIMEQQGTLDQAKELIRNKSFVQAREILAQHANQGNAEAQGLLGEMYWFGDGVASDLKEAEKWFRAGAKNGDAKAKGFVALILQREMRKDEINFYLTENGDSKYRYLENKCVTPSYDNNSYSYNQKLNVIWRKCYREHEAAIKQAKQQDQLVVPEDLINILTETEIKKIEASSSKLADLILENMEKNKKEIDKALVAWAEVRRDEIKNTIGDPKVTTNYDSISAPTPRVVK